MTEQDLNRGAVTDSSGSGINELETYHAQFLKRTREGISGKEMK